jgi:MarR family transcriptional regulator, organic hydroperoxide resistance regulator
MVGMDDDILAIQLGFPQIYLACHVRHARTRSNASRLSERDHAVLAHFSFGEPRSLAEVAKHVGIGAPTMSEAVKRFVRLGYVERARSSSDRRAVSVRLTELGARALQSTSVLDTERLRDALATLSKSERAAAVAGLGLLARAARDARAAHGSRGRRDDDPPRRALARAPRGDANDKPSRR